MSEANNTDKTFDQWFVDLTAKVLGLNQIYHPYFDLENKEAWRNDYQNGLSPEDCLRQILKAVTD